MVTGTLYEPEQFEPLIDEPWAPERIKEAIAEIVTDADTAFDLTRCGPHTSGMRRRSRYRYPACTPVPPA